MSEQTLRVDFWIIAVFAIGYFVLMHPFAREWAIRHVFDPLRAAVLRWPTIRLMRELWRLLLTNRHLLWVTSGFLAFSVAADSDLVRQLLDADYVPEMSEGDRQYAIRIDAILFYSKVAVIGLFVSFLMTALIDAHGPGHIAYVRRFIALVYCAALVHYFIYGAMNDIEFELQGVLLSGTFIAQPVEARLWVAFYWGFCFPILWFADVPAVVLSGRPVHRPGLPLLAARRFRILGSLLAAGLLISVLSLLKSEIMLRLSSPLFELWESWRGTPEGAMVRGPGPLYEVLSLVLTLSIELFTLTLVAAALVAAPTKGRLATVSRSPEAALP